MVPLGGGSLDGATQGFAVGDGVDVTTPAVGVGCGLALGLGRDVDPHATARAATPASAARRRSEIAWSADSCGRLLVSFVGLEVCQMFARPCIDGIDHSLQVNARGRELVRRARWHLRVNGAPHKAKILEAVEANLESRGVATANRAPELIEAERPVEEGSDDMHRPLLLKDLYRFVNRAVVAFSIHVVVPPSRSGS
jgi:hypothetical protein